jgi:hypothetical protein
VLDVNDAEALLLSIAANNARNSDPPRVKGQAFAQLIAAGIDCERAAKAVGAASVDTAERWAAITQVDARVAHAHEYTGLPLHALYAISRIRGLSGAGQFNLAREYLAALQARRKFTPKDFAEYCQRIQRELDSRTDLKAQHAGQELIICAEDDPREAKAFDAAGSFAGLPHSKLKGNQRPAALAGMLDYEAVKDWATRNPAKFIRLIKEFTSEQQG